MPTFKSTRKGKKCFFVMSLRLSYHKVLRNIASSSQVYFLTFFARISYFNFLEFREFNKIIIPFALVGYETGYSYWLFTISYPTRAHGIIVNYSLQVVLLNGGLACGYEL